MTQSGKAPMPEILPGTYPGDVPPGLEASIEAAAQGEQQQAEQPIRHRNRLQKAATPRTHTYDDPGVAAADTEPLLHASKPSEPILSSSNEPGSSDYTWDSSTPRAPLESIRSQLHTATPEPQVQGEGLTHDSHRVDMSRSQKTETADRTTKPSTTSAPYWGDLGKERERDGHESMRSQAHSEYTEPHARMSQQSPPSAKPIIAGADNSPSGGVYNTVVGHGSQDNEITRPTQSTTPRTGGTSMSTAPSDDDGMRAVPLDDIPEASRETPSMGARGASSSFARDDTHRNDITTMKPVSRDIAHDESPPKINMASRPAYPVETTPQESHHRTRQSASPSGYWPTEQAAVPGKGPTRSEAIGTPSSGSSAEPQTTGRIPSQSPGQHMGYQPTMITARSPAEKATVRDDDSMKGEKRHSFLSMFHRHKREEPTKETTATTTPSERVHNKPSGEDTSSEDNPWSPIVADMEYIDAHPGPGMKKAAAWEAAGVAGVMGMLHRGKTVSGGASERRKSSISHPMSPCTGGPGAEGKETREEGGAAPFEHPREPPSPPTRREHGTFGPASLTAPQIPMRASTTKEHGTYDRPPTMNVPDPDITRGDVASREYTKYNTFTSPTGGAPQQGMTTTETREYRGTAYTQAPVHTARGMTAPDAGYSAAPSGMQAGAASAMHPEHKHLPHHAHFTPTAEDLQESQRTGVSHEQHTFLAAPIPTHSHGTRPNPSQESVPGVTTYPHPAPEHTVTPDSYTAPSPREHRQEREMATKPMPPGAAAAYTPTTGLSPPPAHSQAHTPQYPSHPQLTQQGMSREGTMPDTYMGPAPLQQHKQTPATAAAHTPPTAAQPARHTMHYPVSSQPTKAMSPEVMPDSHTASSPRKEQAPVALAEAAMPSAKAVPSQKGYNLIPEHNMSPEVMPDAYTASVIPPNESHQASGMTMGGITAAIGSGLAAAMGLGGSYSAKDQQVDTEMGMGRPGMGMGQEMGMHVGGSGRTMYKCVHCGCENDISGVVERAREEWKAAEGGEC
ncbi:hypothetical protein C8A05DRAFT_37465 [Staphylotrichum tortipilum]|uniref:Uncharacterized protein n=1 Tax=Staphylotrichum tortipilum TaxID=2831512 RepID=A0AAN6RQ64_9PEZI|nr:hypothetical protein C8A05DRAFT_37465 [Staphylotrichum longicolle]